MLRKQFAYAGRNRGRCGASVGLTLYLRGWANRPCRAARWLCMLAVHLVAIVVILSTWLFAPSTVQAHPGGTDGNGCHTCRTNCTERWGISYGFYHRHRPVRACFAPQRTPKPAPAPTPTPRPIPTSTPTLKPVATSTPVPVPISPPSAADNQGVGTAVVTAPVAMWLRRDPRGPDVETASNGTRFVLTGRQEIVGDVVWIELRGADDQVWWATTKWLEVMRFTPKPVPTQTPSPSPTEASDPQNATDVVPNRSEESTSESQSTSTPSAEVRRAVTTSAPGQVAPRTKPAEQAATASVAARRDATTVPTIVPAPVETSVPSGSGPGLPVMIVALIAVFIVGVLIGRLLRR